MTWGSITLGDIAVHGGGSVDPRKFPSEVFELYSIPAFDQGTPETVPGSEIGSAKKLVQPDDVMVSRIVPHIRRAWVVGPKNSYRQIASGEWIVFRSDKVWPQYLRWILVGDMFHAAFMQTVSGVGGSLLRARPAEVFKIKIPVPPLAEQKRIAAILNAADTLRIKRHESLRQLDILLQSTFLHMFGDPVTNPKGFIRCNLGNIFSFRTGKLDSNAAIKGGQYPFFTCSRETFSIDEFAFDCEALLLSGNNANADYSVKYFKGKFNAYQRTYVITVDEKKLNYEYSRLALEFLLADLKHFSKGSNTKYLTMVILNKMPILLPPLDLQHHFATIVESVEKQKTRLRAHLTELDALFASLQARAFNGEL
ncbi:restriction endonuclease subunit S [Nitrosomonas sp. Nm34]|uniref:restriction endonuclease subunit S n=1 Tax=Nitrosomonas sp. Nm34 TaxID=1881055 RepID=UPI0008EF0620|nr:restriction endonuclease subunit S [Nitrosomonas sp. Nm34]SFI82943.1 type I restriction enzyme, S subunit [Nitrosomonas sp. Nm34]